MSKAVIAALALGALTLSILTPTDQAIAEGTQTVESTDAENAQLMLLLDASGSMNEPDAQGEPRIEAARSALGVTVEALRDEQQVGLRVFGATVAEAEDPGACTDSQLLVPIGAENRDELLAAAEQYAPQGHTPIGYALEQAGEDLGASGKRSILLVSDGLSNCDPDPCEVAKNLADDGVNLMINVIGFEVDDQAREQLTCISEAGNGSYVDALDAEGLERAAVLLATRAFRPFSVMGEAVAGSDSVANAPVITAGTQYMDEFDGNSDGTYYLVERQVERSTIAVGVSGRAPSRMTDAMYARLYPESRPDRACSQDHESFGGGAAHHLLALGAGVFSIDADDPCMTDDRLILEITGFRKTDQRMPYEIRIQEDPFPENASELATLDRPDSGWTMAGAEDGADGVVEGGSSLNDRAAIEPGSYTADILPGEAQYFRVPVDWGQRLKVRAITEAIDPDRYAVGAVTLRVLDPLGADITNVNVRDDEGNNPFDVFTRGSAVTVATTPTAPALAARGDFSRMGSGSTLAGEHTLVVAVSAMEGVPLIPYTLTVEVEGEPTGVPGFGEATPTESDEPGAEAAEESDEGVSLVALGAIAAGLVVVAALVTGLVFWLRSRAKRSESAT